MVETSLLDAPVASAGATLAQAEAQAQEYVRLAQAAVDSVLTLGRYARAAWESHRSAVQGDQGERFRALRGVFLQNLGKGLALIRRAQSQADRTTVLSGEALPRADQLATVLAEVEAVQREAISRWQVHEGMLDELATLDLVPLRVDETGAIRVGQTRITLDVLLARFHDGMGAEEMLRQFDTLTAADVYGMLAYYHRHKEDVDAYLKRRQVEAAQLRQQIEAAQGPLPAELKAKMEAFKARRDAGHVASPE